MLPVAAVHSMPLLYHILVNEDTIKLMDINGHNVNGHLGCFLLCVLRIVS